MHFERQLSSFPGALAPELPATSVVHIPAGPGGPSAPGAIVLVAAGAPHPGRDDRLHRLRLHAGALDEAKDAFEEAWTIAKKRGNRLEEFMALEHLVMVSIHRRDPEEACQHAKELAAIGEKLREGSERPLGRAMLALCQYQKGEIGQRAALEDALQQLRDVDAKQRLAFVLTQAAAVESERGDLERAAVRAAEAEAIGRILQQPSESALARAVLLRIAREQGDAASVQQQAAELREINGYAKHVGLVVERELAAAAALSPRWRWHSPRRSSTASRSRAGSTSCSSFSSPAAVGVALMPMPASR